ncbi:MAG: hypothetical protein AB4042_09890 [Leptolyngbyaceae cyanobacterium]
MRDRPSHSPNSRFSAIAQRHSERSIALSQPKIRRGAIAIAFIKIVSVQPSSPVHDIRERLQ